MDSRWLYRAAGTVGLASGIWLVGAGGAQADETENLPAPALDGLLGSVVAPTAGLTGGLTGDLLDSQLPLTGLATGLPTPATETTDLWGPALLPPLTDSLLAQAPAAPVAALPAAAPVAALPAAAPVAALPVAAPVAALPVDVAGALPVDPGSVLGVPLPASGEQVPALIADQLAAEAGLSPEHLTPELLPGLPALPELPVLGAVSGLVPGF